jgi:hypothetical protein
MAHPVIDKKTFKKLSPSLAAKSLSNAGSCWSPNTICNGSWVATSLLPAGVQVRCPRTRSPRRRLPPSRMSPRPTPQRGTSHQSSLRGTTHASSSTGSPNKRSRLANGTWSTVLDAFSTISTISNSRESRVEPDRQKRMNSLSPLTSSCGCADWLGASSRITGLQVSSSQSYFMRKHTSESYGERIAYRSPRKTTADLAMVILFFSGVDLGLVAPSHLGLGGWRAGCHLPDSWIHRNCLEPYGTNGLLSIRKTRELQETLSVASASAGSSSSSSHAKNGGLRIWVRFKKGFEIFTQG